MTFIKSLILSFSMFSALPMPNIEWNKRNMRYMMCAFPFVGEVIAIIQAMIIVLYAKYNFTNVLFIALLLLLLPIIITGGIHLDGFMDTSDAISSHASIEKKLEILKDSHCGSFAILFCALYIISYFVLSNMYIEKILLNAPPSPSSLFIHTLCASQFFVQSRILSALAVASFPIAKKSGLVYTFSDASAKNFTKIFCIIFYILLSVALVTQNRKNGIIQAFVPLAVFLYYYFFAKKNFAGITGDTAGYFVQVTELLTLLAISI